MDLSHLANDMKMLFDGIQDSCDARFAFIKDNTKKVHEMAKDTHGMMNKFGQEHRQMGKRQRNQLHEFHENLEENTDNFRRTFRNDFKKQAAATHRSLRQQMQQIQNHVQKFRDECQDTMTQNQKHLRAMHNAFRTGCKEIAGKRAAFARAHG